MTATEAKWAQRVRDWQISGKTAETYAEGQGFKSSTLRFWASRLRSMAKAGAPPSTSSREPSDVQLVRVRRVKGSGPSPVDASASAATSPSARIVIAVGAVRIEVQPGFNRALLGEIIATLGVAR